MLTPMPLDSGAARLAQQLRPWDALRWWMGDCPQSHRRRLVRNGLRAEMITRHVNWRRAVRWLAARTIWGGVHHVELAKGSVLEPGNWSKVWDGTIVPLILDRARDVAREARNILRSQSHNFKYQ